MKRYGNDQVAAERLTLQTLLQDVSEGLCERHPIGVFQVMDNLAKSTGEQQRGSREIKRMLAFDARTAESFDRRRRLTAF